MNLLSGRNLGLFVATFGLFFAPSAGVAEGAPKYPALHLALHELREARIEMRDAGHEFGGHREAAIRDTNAAIVQIEKALLSQDDLLLKFKAEVDPERYKKYPLYPHIHHALHELAVARTELKDAKHDFGGHRERAIKDIDAAITQLELAIKFATKK